MICASSIWNYEYDFRPKLHDAKFNYHFITAILKSQNSVNNNIFWSISQFVEKRKQKAFTSHFVFETERMRYRAKMVRFKTEMMRFRTWMMRFGTDVIESKKKCDSWINHTAESQSDYKDDQWFQTGYTGYN